MPNILPKVTALKLVCSDSSKIMTSKFKNSLPRDTDSVNTNAPFLSAPLERDKSKLSDLTRAVNMSEL